MGQIHQPGQRFIEAGTGLLESGQVRKTANAGYWFRVSLGKYGKKEGVYGIGLLMQRKYYQPVEELLAVNQYFLEGTFAPKSFATADRLFYLNPVAGVLIGYEGIHSGKAFSTDSAAVNPNRFLVGFTGGLAGEWNMTSKTAFILFARATYLPSSAIERFHFQYGIGIRFNYFKD
ncbi:hypothetical protein GXP67_01275 [Rhodocytophaga rosea]|uniref:Conjugal transfer protein TraO n=1 Tax=Rhodocytophaga rosea TaxID=2704465 RepID=A0A6C0GC51_9BACT|nr:conjugal transfer protein TraO [Rhodocytophaga rosea]QHT65402.1 hypothetical protein GXP67_01275 [Rhodocytophaga rosea]